MPEWTKNQWLPYPDSPPEIRTQVLAFVSNDTDGLTGYHIAFYMPNPWQSSPRENVLVSDKGIILDGSGVIHYQPLPVPPSRPEFPTPSRQETP